MEIRKFSCSQCGYLCGLLAHFDEAGRLQKIEPDPERYPYDAAIMRRCRRFTRIIDVLDHPTRVNYPLKRVGQRGSGQWQRLTWDQAIDEIALRLEDLRNRYGSETLATCIGGPHDIFWPLHRFLNLFGSPNNIGVGQVCWNPGIWIQSLTYGWPIEDELEPDLTACAILWGVNPAESDNSLFWHTINRYSKGSGYLIVIDPRRTRTAAKADMWLPVRPGTDGMLALGMVNIIIEQGLFDKAFVNTWCSGFDALRQRVKAYNPSVVEEVTGIPRTQIAEAARRYSTEKPAALFSGLGIDQSGGYNCTQTLRSLAILRAVTGNLCEPGASHLCEMPDFIPEVELELSDLLSSEQRAKRLGPHRFRLQTYESHERLTHFTKLHGKTLPLRYLTTTHPYLVWQAIMTGDPYPIRALMVMASNPLLSQADTSLVYRALMNLDLLTVQELFMTPTAMLADYVLPAAGSLEAPVLQTHAGVANIAYGGRPVMPPLYERRSSFYFWRDLGRRLGQERYWPWETLEDALDEVFRPAHLTWKTFCETGIYCPPYEYHQYRTEGFATPSGKVELHATLLEELGCDPLPSFAPIDHGSATYPLKLMTGARQQPYFGTEWRQVEGVRRARPVPVVEMDPATAASLGLEEGMRVWVETAKGRIQHTVGLVEMLPGLVSVEYGWWYPEQSAEEPSLGGVWKSNANVLTSADVEACDPILGQWSYRTLDCKVYKVNEAAE